MKIILAGLVALALGGCAMNQPIYDFSKGYEDALAAARDGGSGDEASMERFQQFMSTMDQDSIRERTQQIYAPGAYLNDNLNEVVGAAAIEAHFAKSLEGLSNISVRFDDTVRSGDDWYVRWTMSTTFRSLRDGATVVTSGMSHIRFDEQGRVLLHRDFWDAATGVYEHIPLLGGAMRSVKRRIAGE